MMYTADRYPKGKGQNSTTLIWNCTTVVQFAYIYIDQIILFSRNLLTDEWHKYLTYFWHVKANIKYNVHVVIKLH